MFRRDLEVLDGTALDVDPWPDREDAGDPSGATLVEEAAFCNEDMLEEGVGPRWSLPVRLVSGKCDRALVGGAVEGC